MTATGLAAPALTLRSAGAMVAAAVDAAERAGVRVAVVVVDAAGQIVCAQRMDGAYLTALTIAERKAFTAANFRVSTESMRERLADPAYQLLIQSTDTRLAFLPGGVPVTGADGTVVGAIGVSGGSGAQDVAVCDAAVAAA